MHFAPYDSPLKHFKAYRYHPQFLQDIEGGFGSLTFSNNIDVNKTLCIYEAAGGVCNDPKCNNQHFHQMELTGA